jgi:hypothetical protein
MNETQFEDDVMEETQENTSLQTERNIMSKNDEKQFKQFFCFQRAFEKGEMEHKNVFEVLGTLTALVVMETLLRFNVVLLRLL